MLCLIIPLLQVLTENGISNKLIAAKSRDHCNLITELFNPDDPLAKVLK